MNSRNKRTFEITSIRRTFEVTNTRNNELKAKKQYPEKALKANAFELLTPGQQLSRSARSNVLRRGKH